MDAVELICFDTTDKPVFKARDFISYQSKKKGVTPPLIHNQVILSFFPSLYHTIKRNYKPEIIDFLNRSHPIYNFTAGTVDVSFISPGFGAPLSAAFLELMIDLGGREFIVIGTAGSLIPSVKRNELLVPCKALRDEGTSFHYAKPSRHTFPDEHERKKMTEYLINHDIPFKEGIVWTCDGIYRETHNKMIRLVREGCICVDMESAALFAVAAYHNVSITSLLVAADSLASGAWNPEPPAVSSKYGSAAEMLNIAIDVLQGG